MNILIFGPSGSGKTYTVKTLQQKGINAVDADTLFGLYSWYDKDGKKVRMPDDAGIDFLDTHSFLWDRKFLKEYLDTHPDSMLFGASGNIFEMLDLFDKTFYLDVPDEVMNERLQHPSRENSMGKKAFQRKRAIAWGHMLREKAKHFGIPIINGTESPLKIFRMINS